MCPNQSSSRPSNSCKYQLLPIVCEIYKSFDSNSPNDVMGILLEIKHLRLSVAWWSYRVVATAF